MIGAGTKPDVGPHRARRLRSSEAVRRMVSETSLEARHLVQPLFAREDLEGSRPIPSMPGQALHGVAAAVGAAGEALKAGVPAVLVFGIPATKDDAGSQAWAPDGISQRAIAELKQTHGDALTVIADLCLCEYTDHGHCGIVGPGGVENDATLVRYQEIAVAQARAGADFIAPSGMMDGQVAAVRAALDESGHGRIGILAYAAKYASGFYGPFREAAASAPRSGDRLGYQMDPANRREAMKELRTDLSEGADVLMVKPALAYLDVLAQARAEFDVPLAAYNVSAEYSMVMAAAERGWIDERRVAMEILTAIRRAGADIVITYHAMAAAGWLAEA
ncbi:MAG: porphobilinogen synthase [Candidatus Dormibacterales bacterium]